MKKISKIAGVYKITNKSNGKIYVGSSTDVEKKLDDHKTALTKNIHPNIHLQSDFNKCGAENFKFECVQEVTTNNMDTYDNDDEERALTMNLKANKRIVTLDNRGNKK